MARVQLAVKLDLGHRAARSGEAAAQGAAHARPDRTGKQGTATVELYLV